MLSAILNKISEIRYKLTGNDAVIESWLLIILFIITVIAAAVVIIVW